LLTALLAVAAVGASVAAVAHATAGAPAAAELLPDLDQETPNQLLIAHVGHHWLLGFQSAVRNVGAGPLLVNGRRSSRATPFMQAEQQVMKQDRSSDVYRGVGRLRYVRSPDHQHWHLLRFERYALRSLTDPGVVVRDRKQGFCLSNGFAEGWCSQDRPRARVVDMGLRPDPTYADVYKARVEGQEIAVDRRSAPSGRYDLVHTVNPAGRLREASTANDSSSVEISLTWPRDRDRAPRVRVLKRCPGSPTCGAVSGP
jgi:hypothetical protein